ncbi:MAG TPA: hypothetical protein VM580_27915 [Labilithrix sp.]|jgi:hypothetical protein|nr:hypothetical protein [Labilithrix sp.]
MNHHVCTPRASARKKSGLFAALPLLFVTTAACIGTTGSELVSFDAFAAGPADVPADTSTRGLSFVNGRGWSITLTLARVRLGAVYLNRSVPVSGGQERACFLPGVYVAQVLSGVTIDALSPALQPFPERGNGTADHAVTGEVWLTGGRVDAEDDRTAIAEVAGTATRDGESMRFEGTITIGRNRRVPETDPARPGTNPLCAERIVTPIPTSITPTPGGSLVVRVDPRGWFKNVELGELEQPASGSDLRSIPDDSEGQPAKNLYDGLRHASDGVYTFEWIARGS